VQDPGDGRGEETIGAVVESQLGADEQQLAERVGVEREGDLDRDLLRGAGRALP